MWPNCHHFISMFSILGVWDMSAPGIVHSTIQICKLYVYNYQKKLVHQAVHTNSFFGDV